MNWKFSCEIENEIQLPPEYTFPRAFNYLNSSSNSFYILEGQNGYIQVAGEKSKCTVELRKYENEGKFRHFVFSYKTGSNELATIKMSDGEVSRKERHCFGFLKAAKIFQCYFDSTEWPEDVIMEDITDQFS